MLPDYDDLVNEIKSMRKDLGWSQKKLANTAGVSQSLVAKLEQRENVPNYKNVRKIYQKLKDRTSSDIETAGDLANPDIVSVSPEDTRGRAAEIMRENDYSQLPVKEGDYFVGIVLSKDIGLVDNDVLVEEIMKSAVSIIPENTPKGAIGELLKSSNAVLVKDEEILGIITPADLL